MCTVYTNAGLRNLSGVRDDEEDDDYENMTPPYKDLPPKPGSMAPPRPPRAGKKMEKPSLPCKTQKMAGLELTPVSCTSQQGVELELSSSQPPPVTTPVPWISQEPRGPGHCWEDRLMVCLYLLVVVSLLLGCIGLAVTLVKYQAVVEELRMLTFQQMAWQANVTGMSGLAGLKKDIDLIRADTDQALVELRGLLDCTKVTCPDGWIPFEGKCYYFSPSTRSWDGARKFCQENYSHLVIISSFAEQLIFWDPQEPNNLHEEDCASMNKGGTWNDLSCDKTTYWICERKCSC
ncbi:C-type lectin domain family 17, member A [Orycteropus afer afer]|uniref:C-type lectin domain family 17, member A n=1 Tax=Orycteropus afer afer TaxID=1230840 RepID=A0AC54ZE81_ORYAF|nr:C-type lectin domain family 17, member A [Orycteropus afer afer]